MRTVTAKSGLRRFRPPAPPAAPTPPRLLLDPLEAAAALKISPRTLWRLTKAGEIPYIRIGRQTRYGVAVLERWIASKSGAVQGQPDGAAALDSKTTSAGEPEVS
ncbi:MAG: helix-turn-helix domain-containing protein [Planctomycetota bacterium]|nr:helix-turn-helix domain-containing protein [Planctomycetota bacterium]